MHTQIISIYENDILQKIADLIRNTVLPTSPLPSTAALTAISIWRGRFALHVPYLKWPTLTPEIL